MSKIELEHLTKRFGDFVAVNDVSLAIPAGSIFGLLGPNGAGKTTLIRMIMHIFLPDEGRILIDGEKLSPRLKRRIGYLPEERGLYKKMKVGEHLAYLGRLKGLEAHEARRRAAHYLERLGLSAWTRKKVEDLSKGMQQKVQFAAALIHDPSIVILDEPFSGLDPLNRQLLMDWIAELRTAGVTIIFSTHQMETVESLCESMALINRGRVLRAGALRDIKRSFGTERIRLALDNGAGFTPDGPGVRRSTRDGAGGWEIELEEGNDGQALLSRAMTHAKVERFERVELTLHEIFVRLVQGAQAEPEAGKSREL